MRFRAFYRDERPSMQPSARYHCLALYIVRGHQRKYSCRSIPRHSLWAAKMLGHPVYFKAPVSGNLITIIDRRSIKRLGRLTENHVTDFFYGHCEDRDRSLYRWIHWERSPKCRHADRDWHSSSVTKNGLESLNLGNASIDVENIVSTLRSMNERENEKNERIYSKRFLFLQMREKFVKTNHCQWLISYLCIFLDTLSPTSWPRNFDKTT